MLLLPNELLFELIQPDCPAELPAFDWLQPDCPAVLELDVPRGLVQLDCPIEPLICEAELPEPVHCDCPSVDRLEEAGADCEPIQSDCPSDPSCEL